MLVNNSFKVPSSKIEAVILEHFVKDYTPKCWKEHIGRVMFIPFFTDEDITEILSGCLPARWNVFPFNEAIRSFIDTRRGKAQAGPVGPGIIKEVVL